MNDVQEELRDHDNKKAGIKYPTKQYDFVTALKQHHKEIQFKDPTIKVENALRGFQCEEVLPFYEESQKMVDHAGDMIGPHRAHEECNSDDAFG